MRWWGYLRHVFWVRKVMFKTTRPIDKLIIHCSATKPSMDIGAKEIRKWHTDKPPNGNGWSDIGYHYVIRRDGTVEPGRPLALVGAHVAGHNTGSHGICLVGGIPEANFTKEQWDQLARVVRAFKAQYPKATVHGHNEFDAGKACPSFDVQKWLRDEGI